MKDFTFIITSKNNEDTIIKCIDSCKSAKANILIVDLGSNDKTADIAEKSGEKTISYGFYNDYSIIKNKLIEENETEWMMFLSGNEFIHEGIDNLEQIKCEGNCKKVFLIQDQIITKPTRIIKKSHKCFFTNPVFENLNCKSTQSEIYIKSTIKNNSEENIEIIKKWMKDKPLAIQPHYYLSCVYLSQSKWSEFIKSANYYLFLEKQKNPSYFMTKYYLAMVYSYIEKNYQLASQHLFEIIIEKPLMAEYWCLLGDIYYSLDKYEKAFHFYDNAKILGSRRLKEDDFPLHIDKYKKHPDEMMVNCKKVIESMKIYVPNK